MTQRYIYADKVGAGPEHPKKQWGLFSTELTSEQAATRYALDGDRSSDWFGIVLLEAGAERPSAYLQMSPHANGVKLHKLNAHGSIEAAYSWGSFRRQTDSASGEGGDDRLFLSQMIWYAYPEGKKFMSRSKSIGNVTMQFRPDGYAKEDRVTRRGFNEPDAVETREFQNVDVSANWFHVPEFGDWGAFFQPEPGQ